MKIAFLLLLTGHRAQTPGERHAIFPHCDDEKVEEGSKNESTVELFRIQTINSSEDVTVELVAEYGKIKGSCEVYNIFGVLVLYGPGGRQPSPQPDCQEEYISCV